MNQRGHPTKCPRIIARGHSVSTPFRNDDRPEDNSAGDILALNSVADSSRMCAQWLSEDTRLSVVHGYVTRERRLRGQ